MPIFAPIQFSTESKFENPQFGNYTLLPAWRSFQKWENVWRKFAAEERSVCETVRTNEEENKIIRSVMPISGNSINNRTSWCLFTRVRMKDTARQIRDASIWRRRADARKGGGGGGRGGPGKINCLRLWFPPRNKRCMGTPWRAGATAAAPSFASDIASLNFLKILMCPTPNYWASAAPSCLYQRAIALVTNEPRISIFQSLRFNDTFLYFFIFVTISFSFYFLVDSTIIRVQRMTRNILRTEILVSRVQNVRDQKRSMFYSIR